MGFKFILTVTFFNLISSLIHCAESYSCLNIRLCYEGRGEVMGVYVRKDRRSGKGEKKGQNCSQRCSLSQRPLISPLGVGDMNNKCPVFMGLSESNKCPCFSGD